MKTFHLAGAFLAACFCPALVMPADAQSDSGTATGTTSGTAPDPAIRTKAELEDYLTANIQTLLTAAKQGDPAAQFRVGIACSMGWGVPKNDVEACKWFILAGTKGNDQAKQFLQSMESRLTADQMAEAQKLARDFKPESDATDAQKAREQLKSSMQDTDIKQ